MTILKNNCKVIFENDDFMVVDKAYGVLSQSNRSFDLDLVSMVRSATKKKDVTPINRLDRNVAGLIVLALNKNAAARLNKDMIDHGWDKTYVLACQSEDADKLDIKGHMQDQMDFDKKNNLSFVCKNKTKTSKNAELDYEKLYSDKDVTFFRVHLKTGRHHQIRLQFASRSCPLIGDGKYGSKIKASNIALYSTALTVLGQEFEVNPKFQVLEFKL